MEYIEHSDVRKMQMHTLNNGDCLSQREFHKIYEQQDEDFAAELIDGIVFVREPPGMPHADMHPQLITLLGHYCGKIPAVQLLLDATTILGPKDEVQPDAIIRIRPEYGGRTSEWFYGKKKKRIPYLQGAPEFVAEVSHSSRAIDLHLKKDRYTHAGVLEYLVVCLAPLSLHWFDLKNQTTITPDDDGIFRSRVMPGLWIDPKALFSANYEKSMEILNAGIASPEHATFVRKLQAQKQ